MKPTRNISPDPRRSAFELLCRVETGGYADLLLDAELDRTDWLDQRDRGLLTELVYGVLRQRGRLDFALGRFVRQPLTKIEMPVLQLLRLGAYQLLELDRIPPSAAVNTTVAIAKSSGLQRAAGFINGCLRSLDRGRSDIPWPDCDRDPAGYLRDVLSLPSWLTAEWCRDWGLEPALRLAERLQGPAPLTLRANTLRTTREALLAKLAGGGITATPCEFAPEGITVAERAAFDLLDEGEFQVQDEASILVGHLLGCRPGEKLLDACAAPGGKTTHLAALADNQADILALDLHPQRLKLVKRGAERLGCRGVATRCWDLTRPPDFLEAMSFDRVLVDAPCSGLGVLRRNPELRWRRQPNDLARLATVQRRILGNVAPLLRRGGTLLYSLCTTSRQETTGVVDDFLATHPEFRRESLVPVLPESGRRLIDDAGQLFTWPVAGELDGFFAVRLVRSND